MHHQAPAAANNTIQQVRTQDKFVKLTEGDYKDLPPTPPTIMLVGSRPVTSLDIKERTLELKRPIEFEAATMVIRRDFTWQIDTPTPSGDRQEMCEVGFRPVFEFRDGTGPNTYGETVTRVRHTTDARVVGMSTTYAMTPDMINLFRENKFLTDKYVPRLRKERTEHHRLVRSSTRATQLAVVDILFFSSLQGVVERRLEICTRCF